MLSKIIMALLFGVVVAFVVGGVFSVGVDATEVQIITQASSTEVYLSSATLPLRISGMVESANSAVLSAKVAGEIISLPVREGQSVTRGTVVAVQEAPVTSARMALVTAEGQLTQLQQAEVAATADLAGQQAALRSYSASEVAVLRVAANDTRVRESSEALKNQLDLSMLTIITASDFVNNNRALFSVEGKEMYDEVVANLYGRVPNYFRGSFIRGEVRADSLLAQLDAQVEAGELDLLQLEAISALAAEQLEALRYLLSTGEDDVFDPQDGSTDTLTSDYNDLREAVVSAQGLLLAKKAAYEQVVDETLEDKVRQGEQVVITTVDAEKAALHAEYAKTIKAQSQAVTTAAQVVVAAELSMARPTAPFSGTVAKVHAEVGEYVAPGTPLLTLVGTGAQELEVTVPVDLLPFVSVGTPFVVDGEQYGFVVRTGTVAVGGAGTVVISLAAPTTLLSGQSLYGELEVSMDEAVFAIPRAYVHFDTNGPYIVYSSQERSPVVVVYDAGSVVYVRPAVVHDVSLVPSVSIGL